MSLNHIIAATDLSPASLHGIDRGFVIASQSGCRYTVVHALGLDALAPLQAWLGERSARVSEGVSEEARARLDALLAEPGRNRGVDAAVRLEDGQATAALTRLAAEEDTDLIVIGARGGGFFQRMLPGSTASRLLRKTRCPILIVQQSASSPYRRALVAIDFSPASLLALRVARALSPGIDLVLLHVFDVPFEGKLRYAGVDDDVIDHYRDEARVKAARQLDELARSAGLGTSDYTALVVHGDATAEIVRHETSLNCDLVVMGKHGQHVTEELLLGSVTRRVLSEVNSDVLVIVEPQSAGTAKVTP